MTVSSERGLQALRTISEVWQVEEDRSEWSADGFDWWPGNFKQFVRVSEVDTDGGEAAFKILAITDLLVDAPVFEKDFLQELSRRAEIAPAYSIRVVPEEFARQNELGEEAKIVQLVSTAYVNEQLIGLMPKLFAGMAALQAVAAETEAELLASRFGGRPARSTPPGSTKAPSPHPILDSVRAEVAPVGKGESRWAETSEFEEFAARHGASDSCVAEAGPRNLTLQTPFGTDSALIQLRTQDRHPSLGSGLKVTLHLPWFPGEERALESTAAFNMTEEITFTRIPLLGGWFVDRFRGVGPAFSCFVPNVLHGLGPGIATNIALWMLARARWIRRTYWPEMEDLTMGEIIERRR